MKKLLVLSILSTLLFTSCSKTKYEDNPTTNKDNPNNSTNTNNGTNNNSSTENPSNPSNPGGSENQPIDVDGDHGENPQVPDNPNNPQTEEDDEEEVYDPNPIPLDIESELEPEYNSMSLSHNDVELDCHKERTNSNPDNNTNFEKGKTTATLPKSTTITCTYGQQPNYSNSDLSVYWFIDEVDNPYFALTNITQSTENSSVTVVATEQSRLATLTAALIYKGDTTRVLKTLTCCLRSVMINIFQASTINSDYYSGGYTKDIGKGYQTSFFNKQYSENDDIVVPSVLKIGNYVRSVSRLISFSDPTGTMESYSSLNQRVDCRYLYIPNSVYSINRISSVYAHKKIIFADGDINFLYAEMLSLCQLQSEYYHFYQSIVDETPYEFPFNAFMYGTKAIVPQVITPEYFEEEKQNFNPKTDLRNILAYNTSSAIAFKKI